MQVVYRPEVHPSQAHHPPEFLVMVEEEAYQKWKCDHGSVPLVDVLASSKDPVSIISHGQTGLRAKPPKQELVDNLGTDDPFKAAEFVLLNGKLCKLSAMKMEGFFH